MPQAQSLNTRVSQKSIKKTNLYNIGTTPTTDKATNNTSNSSSNTWANSSSYKRTNFSTSPSTSHTIRSVGFAIRPL